MCSLFLFSGIEEDLSLDFSVVDPCARYIQSFLLHGVSDPWGAQNGGQSNQPSSSEIIGVLSGMLLSSVLLVFFQVC
jgi:hypothetical protein